MEYKGDSWLGYDRRFRQTVAGSPGAMWAKIDPTLWNMAFTGQAKARQCKHCFSLSHIAEDCDWAPTPPTQLTSLAVPASKPNLHSRSSQICYSWNHNPDPNCVYIGCKYAHTCLYCTVTAPTNPLTPLKTYSKNCCLALSWHSCSSPGQLTLASL